MGTTPNPATTQTPAATPATNPPADKGYSVDELAAQIKTKMPAYNSWDNHYLVSQVIDKHPEYQTWLNIGGLQELANRSNPNRGIAASDEATRSRTLSNMTAAMAGQPMQNAADQAEAEKGRAAGMKRAAIDTTLGVAGTGAGEVLSAVTKPGMIIRTVPSPILDETGAPIMKTVLEQGPSAVGKAVDAARFTASSAGKWMSANPMKTYLLMQAANELGLGPHKLMKLLHIVGSSAE